MSQSGYSSDGSEFETAVAAAAFAITTLEEESSLAEKKRTGGSDTSLTKIKSKKEDDAAKLPESGKLTRQLTGKETKKGEGSMRISDAVDQRMPEYASADQTAPEKIWDTYPTAGKSPTFTEKYLDNRGSTKPESAIDRRPRPNAPSTLTPMVTTAGDSRLKGNSMAPMKPESKAEAWEREEIAKIKKRYDKTISIIQSWETEKKDKAKRRKAKAERKLERRRGKALEEYNIEISNINKIAGGAKAQAEERKRNEEAKAKEKASKISSTGKAPKTCFCF
eukprot:TRINITY_DN7911_c0_g2_i1.p1 TRINITY_DN7911_c0_g2~~TRINITY_DN7911_c0_g2_i1.p1  ORF type:complete len:279 (-),score=58.88 TRINITY_DN7911_c0_g2_i1:205-1041(-)